jgi:hypothetical protein
MFIAVSVFFVRCYRPVDASPVGSVNTEMIKLVSKVAGRWFIQDTWQSGMCLHAPTGTGIAAKTAARRVCE